MSLSKPRQLELLQQRAQGMKHALLSGDQPTGLQPSELFLVEEQNPVYMSLQPEMGRGFVVSVLAYWIGLPMLILWLLTGYQAITSGRDWEIAFFGPATLFVLIGIPILWAMLEPLQLPILLNRRTQEIYFEHNHELYHAPWDGIQALVYEFKTASHYTGSSTHACLEILMHRLNHPDDIIYANLGGVPIAKNVVQQASFWEYLRAYMNNGPWFDENGNPSESDTFVRSQLKYMQTRPSSHLPNLWQELKAKRGAGEAITSGERWELFFAILYYPCPWLQDQIYKVALKQSSKRWPSYVLERLQTDGPTTRLVDLESQWRLTGGGPERPTLKWYVKLWRALPSFDVMLKVFMGLCLALVVLSVLSLIVLTYMGII